MNNTFWILMLLGAYILALGVYNVTANPDKGALVTNSLLVAVGGGIMYYAYTK
jgi:hypothetical protein